MNTERIAALERRAKGLEEFVGEPSARDGFYGARLVGRPNLGKLGN